MSGRTNQSVFVSALAAVAAAAVFTTAASLDAAELRFNRYFTDNMVLQRDKPVVIKGFADKGANVTVAFADQKKTAVVGDNGTWEVVLDAMPACVTGRTLTVQSTINDQRLTINDVLVGDVFLFALQANVDITLGRKADGRAIAEADKKNPRYRAISIKTIPSLEPLSDLAVEATHGWAAVDAKTALAISEPAYYFGRDLADQLDVPLGLIDLNMGENFTIGWLSRDVLMSSDKFFGKPTRVPELVGQQEDAMDYFTGKKTITDKRQSGKMPQKNPLSDPRYPAAGYNAVLNPLKGIGLKGILLQLGNDYPYLIYQKMARTGRSFDREELTYAWNVNYNFRKEADLVVQYVIPRIPYQWREYFADTSLPMALIAPPSSALGTYAMHHVQIREMQRLAAAANPHVGLIVPGNDALPFSGQPADAALLSSRAICWALGSVYQDKGVTPTGPQFDKMEVQYSKAKVFFKTGTAEGLKAAPGSLDYFEAAGIDGVFFPAKAAIDGSVILLECGKVSQIAYVRYNWQERPDQGLVNAAGLPALPFVSSNFEYDDVLTAEENDLPMEYSTPARDWQGGDVAVVGGKGGVYPNSGYLGTTGLKARPFGPNMLVEMVTPGSPADKKIFVGDMIYGVNGTLLNDDPVRMVGDAVTQAETEAGAGKITFNLRSGGTNKDVDLLLEVLGTYSATSPYDCPKTDRIVANMEEYLAKRGGNASGAAGGGWLHTDQLFLLAAGTPAYQGLVRRAVYQLMSRIDPKTTAMPKSGTWNLAYSALLLGEYYLATGDRNVLPYQKWYCDALAATQVKIDSFGTTLPSGAFGGWRHNYPGGLSYGMLPPIGLPAVLGYCLADEAGTAIDRESYFIAFHLFKDGQAEMGKTIYTPRVEPLKEPDPLDPAKVAQGKVSSNNGSRGTTAILFTLLGDLRIAHLNSLYCVYAYNDCDEGHGSSFFNGLWTPLGAYAHSKPAFINFMRNHHWYQDLRRSHNHAYRADDADAGMGHGLSLVVPRQRLRILGAPVSVFAKNQKDQLQPALKAYYARDYTTAVALANKLLASGDVLKEDKIKLEQLSRAAREIQESIQFDLDKLAQLIKEGKLYEASLDIPQLKGVMPEADSRLAEIERQVTSPEAKATVASDQERYQKEQRSLAFSFAPPSKDDEADKDLWGCLTTESNLSATKKGNDPRKVSEANATRWRVKIVEALSQAPEGWPEESFNDSGWGETTLPISWYLNHTFLGRTTFDVKDKASITSLRISPTTFRQQNIMVYINGRLVAKINNCGPGSRLYAELTPAAVDALRNGRNTLAVATRNNWRWGVYNNIVGDGFAISLEALSKKQTGPGHEAAR